MNHIKKTLKIKGARERTTLVEFLVKKRTDFLEYLKDLHTTNGAFWMNVIHLNISDLGHHFRVPDECIRSSKLVDAPLGPLLSNRFPLERDAGSDCEVHRRESSTLCNEAWQTRYLPALTVLGMSLSDFLFAPLSGSDFVECVYGLLLEMDVAFAGGSTTKAMALHNLNVFREQFAQKFSQLSNREVTDAPIRPLSGVPTVLKTELRSKYLFLRTDVDNFLASPASYDTVVPSLCTTLIFTYRKLCDYNEMKNPEVVKKVLSIDKKINKIFFSRITEEIEVAAHQKLMQQTHLLSTSGLFSGLEAESNLLTTLDNLGSQEDTVGNVRSGDRLHHRSSSSSENSAEEL